MNKIKLKTSIAFIILIIFQLSIKGQNPCSKCNIRQYSYYTNLAELAIVDSSYTNALLYYDSAFQNIDSPFYRDRFNYTVCNALLGNYSSCVSDVIYLLGKGIAKDKFSKNEAFSGFLNSEQGNQILKKEVPITYNTDLRRIYDSIFEADQYFRKKKPRDYRDYYNDTISKIDSTNVSYMIELIEKYGWPTADLIGLDSTSFPKYQFIIIHQGHLKYQVYNFSEDIRIAYKNCLIEPDEAQYLIARSNGSNNSNIMQSGLITFVYDSLNIYVSDSLMSFRHKTGFERISTQNKIDIDNERKLFGLESIVDLRKKVLFSLKDSRFVFKYMGGNQTFTFLEINDYLRAEKSLELY